MLEAARTLWLTVKKWKTLRSFTYLSAIADKEGGRSRGTWCIPDYGGPAQIEE